VINAVSLTRPAGVKRFLDLFLPLRIFTSSRIRKKIKLALTKKEMAVTKRSAQDVRRTRFIFDSEYKGSAW
jgi:hypothetical protein